MAGDNRTGRRILGSMGDSLIAAAAARAGRMPPVTVYPEYTTPKQEAARTNLPRTTLLELIHAGLPHVLVKVSQPSGRRLIRFRPADVDEWLTRRTAALLQRRSQ